MLIILAGLPGAGKTTIARELARQLGAVHVRIDSIEQAIRDSAIVALAVGDAGYRVAYAVAEDNLRIGRIVIADSVNPLPITRDAWLAVVARAHAQAAEIEIICSDRHEHRRRVEARTADIPGHRLPTWQDVFERDYQPWDRARVVIDTAGLSVDESVKMIRSAIGSM